MLHIALWEPEIPPNTGNIARLCAATGTRLHLIGRLGFSLEDKYLKRAGLDYWPAVDLVTHPTFEAFEGALANPAREGGGDPTAGAEYPRPRGPGSPIWCVETPWDVPYTRATFRDGDCLLFGKESTGLPAELRERFAGQMIGLPMPTGKVRSLNLSTAAGIVLYEALRQVHRW